MLHASYVRVNFYYFFHVGLCFVLKHMHVIWRYEQRLIRAIKEDR